MEPHSVDLLVDDWADLMVALMAVWLVVWKAARTVVVTAAQKDCWWAVYLAGRSAADLVEH